MRILRQTAVSLLDRARLGTLDDLNREMVHDHGATLAAIERLDCNLAPDEMLNQAKAIIKQNLTSRLINQEVSQMEVTENVYKQS